MNNLGKFTLADFFGLLIAGSLLLGLMGTAIDLSIEYGYLPFLVTFDAQLFSRLFAFVGAIIFFEALAVKLNYYRGLPYNRGLLVGAVYLLAVSFLIYFSIGIAVVIIVILSIDFIYTTIKEVGLWEQDKNTES